MINNNIYSGNIIPDKQKTNLKNSIKNRNVFVFPY